MWCNECRKNIRRPCCGKVLDEDKTGGGQMTDDEVVLVHHGYWDDMVYKNGKEDLIYTSLRTMSFGEFMDVVHNIVRVDRRSCDYMLHYLKETKGCGVMKLQIRSERDMQRVARLFATPKIYVSIKLRRNRTPSAYASKSLGHCWCVQLMDSEDQYHSQNSNTCGGYMESQIEANYPPISVNA